MSSIAMRIFASLGWIPETLRPLLSIALWVAFSLAFAPCYAQNLTDRLQPLIDKHAGEVSVAIKHLGTGEEFLYRENEVMPTASLIKFPVLVEYYRQLDGGVLARDLAVTLREEDKVPGSGILTSHFLPGTVLPLETAAHLMITYSDNTATNLVLDQVGIANVANTMAEFGFRETQVHSKVFRRDTSIAVERSEKYGLGSTKAYDMVALLEKLHRRELASEDSTQKILAHLLSCDDDTKLMRFLPKGVKGFHKTGAVNAVRTDAGLFHTPSGWIAMVCLTSENEDKSWGDSNAAEILCGRIAEAAYHYFNPQPVDSASEPQLLKIGSNGLFVEALQRALNQRLNPSPNLSIDGDFGGMTEQAVMRFRREHGLSEGGVVDKEMWEKLGEIQFESSSYETLAELAERKPADTPGGVPSVSCKAWIVADGVSGAMLGGYQQSEPLDIASTTKMMTALLIAKEIEASPELIDQWLTFSKRADETVGSSSTVRAGESLPLKDALYGLLLPSGNDASVALAEWYGNRKGAAEKHIDPLQFFIDAMNDEAKRMGMLHTSFRNPHGMTHPEHKSTCEDLVVLARELMGYPLIAEIVATRRHSCLVRGVEGYQRRLVWNNSNQLLGQEGYFGIKTGTTDAAGACLVSLSEYDGCGTIVVVLGSSGSAARYSDSRNLHRWSWGIDRSALRDRQAN